MKGRQKILLLLAITLLILMSSFSYATCMCFMEETPVLFGDNAIFTCSCSNGTEVNQLYNITWRDGNNDIISLHMGTTPGSVNTSFSSTHKVVAFTTLVNATLTGTNLEGQASASVLPSNSDGPKLPLTLGFGLITLLLFIIGFSMVKNENKDVKLEISLLGVQVVSGAFLVMWGLLWLLMDFSIGQSYYSVVKVFFTIYSIILGFIPLVVWLCSGLIAMTLLLGRFFKK